MIFTRAMIEHHQRSCLAAIINLIREEKKNEKSKGKD